METEITTLLFGSFLLLLIIGAPITVALGVSSLVSFVVLGDNPIKFVQIAFTSVGSFPLMALPAFILAGALMEAAGVPVVPGYHGDAQDDATLITEAQALGTPLLIKPVAGGGGKGMHRVADLAELEDALARARREARGAFGDDRLLLERYVERPRHIEVQVFADAHGATVHLYERECSVQRRHQKIIEETPSPVVDDDTRAALGAAAVRAAAAVGYRGAGTVEFVMGPERDFYFLEMNTRLQVEHPVTECITGLDLVEWQLRVAAGEPLPLAQEQIARRGHAIEVRLYAEDPARGFLPSTGRIRALEIPPAEGLRVDAGVEAGDTVTPHYDPMIAKLIVSGADRPTALARLRAVLERSCVFGPRTNLGFLQRLLARPEMRDGAIDTQWVDQRVEELGAAGAPPAAALAATAERLLADERAQAAAQAAGGADPHSPWARLGPWRPGAAAGRRLQFQAAGGEQAVHLVTVAGTYREQRDGELLELSGAGWRVWRDDQQFQVARGAERYDLEYRNPLRLESEDEEQESRLTAPMPGTLIQVVVAAGDEVAKGDLLMVLEAMKMEHRIVAPQAGVIETLGGAEGDFVEADAVLVTFADAGTEDAA